MKKILFVDDEPNVLSGLRRSLRSQRKVWDTTFVESGKEALEAMEQTDFDIVLTDMRMPGMDGAELLKEIKKRHPRTIRFVLSGHADAEASARSVFVSHQFLSKPCDVENLKEVVDRACRLDELLRDHTIQDVLGEISELPVLPRVFVELTEALAEEEVDIARVAGIVEQDAGIATKIMQIVNSSFFGISTRVTDIRQATIYLGVNTIRDLATSFAVFKQFDSGDISLEREQSHSLLAMRIARRIVDDAREAEDAGLAAMLHDIGRLIIAVHFPDRCRAVSAVCADTSEPRHAAEERIMGVSHAEIGGYLLGLWGLPYPVVSAVAHHHQPWRAGETDLGVVTATYVATGLAGEQMEGLADLDDDYLGKIGVQDQLEEWRDIALEEAQALGVERQEPAGAGNVP